MKVLARVFVGLTVSVLIAGCASKSAYIPKIPPKAMAQIQEYKELEGNKVFVIAVDPSGKFASGYDYGKPTVKEALSVASEQCEASREAFGVLSKTYIYAINDSVVYADLIKKDAGE